ncbi:MAG TPA: TIGR04282 family arsenosugar biosynthesis glycosyltransferase [Thermodesulfovibrionales bacterium]|nr:TIGR04282 family arsenosugar biosynthesis glycosyltransferase [Thermodesulfovibrionales bacterium]
MTDTLSILLFVRTPEKGRVKSRLAADLGDEMALVIYKSFLLDILAMLRNGPHPFTLCVYPPDSGEALADWLGPSFTYVAQEGNDLGEKMKNAFARSFSGGTEKAVLIGSDIPDLAIAVIDEAFRSLDTCDAVIGPASDGGYYLIGFRRDRFLPGVFEGILWGTESVFGKTLGLFHAADLSVHVLPQRHDIDTADDLQSLFARNEHSAFRESRTMSFIRENKEHILGHRFS